MKIKSEVFLAVLVLVFEKSHCLGKFNKPVIYTWGTWPDSEHIVSPNVNEDFLCLGNKPLKWKLPQLEESRFLVVSETPTDNKYNYGSRLFIKNMSHLCVGDYYCHYENNSYDNPMTSAKIYIFLDDYNRLSISDPESVTNVTVTKGEEAVLPCRRTSSKVKLELIVYSNDKKIEFDIPREDNTTYRFDERRGIITNDTNNDEIFICKYTRDDQTTLHYVQLKPQIAKPILRSNNLTASGEQLNLRCAVKSPTYVYFSWKIPSGPIKDSRITVTKAQHDERQKLYWQDLVINDTGHRDRGVYTCTVLDYFGHTMSADVSIKLLDTNKEFIYLENARTSDDNHQTVPETKRIEWRVNVWGYPQPVVKWSYKNGTKVIPLTHNDKYKVNFEEESSQAVLVIRNVTKDDVGTYILTATNDFIRDSKYFYIDLKDTKHTNDQLMNFRISECAEIYILSLNENKKYKKKIQDIFLRNLLHQDISKKIDSMLDKDEKLQEKRWFNQCLTNHELYEEKVPDFRLKISKCKTELTNNMLKDIYLPTTANATDLSTKKKLTSTATKMVDEYCKNTSIKNNSSNKAILTECFLALRYAFCINDIYDYLTDV